MSLLVTFIVPPKERTGEWAVGSGRPPACLSSRDDPAVRYTQGALKRLRYFATWLPTATYALGDVGVLQGKVFRRVTTLKQESLRFEARADGDLDDLEVCNRWA